MIGLWCSAILNNRLKSINRLYTTHRRAPLDIIDFYRLEQKRAHDWTRRGISDLAPEEWHYTIEGNGNNIAFLIWHSVRTEDNILRFILEKRPTIWMDGDWHDRLDLPPRGQGTGMPTKEPRALRIAERGLLVRHAENEW